MFVVGPRNQMLLIATAILLLLQSTNVLADTTGKLTGDLRVVGGTDADELPTLAFTAGSRFCSGTLIHPDILLTSAHCAGIFKETGVFLGGTTSDGKGSTFFEVEAEFPHPNYDNTTDANDIMLVKLRAPSDVTPQKVNFDPLFPADGTDATVIGYGAIVEGGKVVPNLQEADIPIVPYDECDSFWNKLDEATQICTGLPDGSRDACQGDSGGPLLVDNVVVGIVSFGLGCGRPGIPSVYAKVSGFEQFITTGICDLSGIPPTTCSDSSPLPVVAPASIPSTTPVVAVPIAAPVGTPTEAPVSSANVSPVATSTLSPVSSPIATPESSPSIAPVSATTGAPGNAPIGIPATTPATVPQQIPVTVPSATTPVATPIISPVSSPTLAPVDTTSRSASPAAMPTDTPLNTPAGAPIITPVISPMKTPSTAPSAAVSPAISPDGSPVSSPAAAPTLNASPTVPTNVAAPSVVASPTVVTPTVNSPASTPISAPSGIQMSEKGQGGKESGGSGKSGGGGKSGNGGGKSGGGGMSGNGGGNGSSGSGNRKKMGMMMNMGANLPDENLSNALEQDTIVGGKGGTNGGKGNSTYSGKGGSTGSPGKGGGSATGKGLDRDQRGPDGTVMGMMMISSALDSNSLSKAPKSMRNIFRPGKNSTDHSNLMHSIMHVLQHSNASAVESNHTSPKKNETTVGALLKHFRKGFSEGFHHGTNATSSNDTQYLLQDEQEDPNEGKFPRLTYFWEQLVEGLSSDKGGSNETTSMIGAKLWKWFNGMS